MIGEYLGGATLMDDSDDDDNRKKQLDEARKNALYYGWEYFKYHAQQRQAVFRFYLILVGVALAGLVASYSNQYSGLGPDRWVIGLSLIILSIMFWRLDVRSYQLVKVAENYLLHEETKLAADLSTQTIRLTSNADANKKAFWMAKARYVPSGLRVDFLGCRTWWVVYRNGIAPRFCRCKA
jgi:hypothetical protein